MHAQPANYYVPHSSPWPILGAVGLFVLMYGTALKLNVMPGGGLLMFLGFTVLIVMQVGWFGQVIDESLCGLYSAQMDRSFRWGMGWFIFSEVMFFAAFFGALYYSRHFAVPWLGGEGAKGLTHEVLWPAYQATWPTNGPATIGGEFKSVGAWGLPALNTIILLTSGVTLTWAHHGLLKSLRQQLLLGLSATVGLGFLFVILQAIEYSHAIHELNLTLGSGIYGSTFYLLTGFHGLHVTLGATILSIILWRAWRGDFQPQRHFAFEAAAWYWHFVDVVWLGLFIFVYWL